MEELKPQVMVAKLFKNNSHTKTFQLRHKHEPEDIMEKKNREEFK